MPDILYSAALNWAKYTQLKSMPDILYSVALNWAKYRR